MGESDDVTEEYTEIEKVRKGEFHLNDKDRNA